MNYTATAKKAATQIKKAGAPMTLRQTVAGEYDPVAGKGQDSIIEDYPCFGVLKTPSYKDAGKGFEDGSLIRTSDKSALVPAYGLDTEPMQGDQLLTANDTWKILLVQTLNPGGVDILHTLYLRKA